MAVSEQIQDDKCPHEEINVTITELSVPPRPPRVGNGNPGCPSSFSSPPSDAHNSKSKHEHSNFTSLFTQKQLIHSLSSGLRRHCEYVNIPVSEERTNRLPAEWWKTGAAFVYALINLIFTTIVITVVNERVPDKSVSPPLPDKFFDYFDRVPWAFTITEVNGLILVGLWLIQWLFLKHKYDLQLLIGLFCQQGQVSSITKSDLILKFI